MTAAPHADLDTLARDVRRFVFSHVAETTQVLQPPQIASSLGLPDAAIHDALQHLAKGKVLILAPNNTNIWAANPFCAVPSCFRVHARGKQYSAICIWDALGVAAALGADAEIDASCGDCGVEMKLEVARGQLRRSEGLIHFAVPARHWWDNIGFT